MKKAPPLSILVVEEDPAIRLSVGDALRAAGHRVLACRSGIEALEALSSRSVTGQASGQHGDPESPPWKPQLDLVICDVQPLQASGLQLFLDVRTSSPGTDVILITSQSGVADAVAALKEGARDYLLKPFDVEELLLRVERVVEQRQLRQQLIVARSELRERPEGQAPAATATATAKAPALAPAPAPVPSIGPVGPLSAAMKEFERAYLLYTLDTTHGRKAAAARQLGISRKNLWEKLRAHGINQPAAGDEAK
jgi:DNA-binding NtrC family response regulator